MILLMLLPASEFLGFVDPMKIAVKGIFDIHALIALIIFASILVSLHKIKIFIKSPFFIPISIFFLFWLYGVLYPWISGNSSLFFSLKSSKEFLTIFSFLAVLLFIDTRKGVELGWKYLVWLGIYYSVLEILGQVIGPVLKANMTYHMRSEEAFFWKIYAPFWPVILISLYKSYYEYAQEISRPFVKLGLSAIGLLLTFFRSYLLAAFVALPTILLICGKGISKTFVRSTLFVFAICFCLIALVFMSFTIGNDFASINKITHKFVFSAVEEITTHTGGSLIGREKVAESRERLLEKQPYFGYGFIDKDSKFGRNARKIITGDNLGFIDMGILDIPIKFGNVGFMIMVMNIILIICVLVKINKQYDNGMFKARCMALAAVSMTYLFVLPVHAPLTYSYGLLPFGISLGLIERERVFLAEERQSSQ
ncbi:MAG: O-antigen ligase family protein [Syntrophotaleaceae bacterium]